jgi:hypothetical protein
VEVHDLSYDPRDPRFATPGDATLQWSVQIFTLSNCYGLAAEQSEITSTESGMLLRCAELSWAGQQQRAAGRCEVRVERVDGALTWHIEAWHDEPIKSIKLLLWGLPNAALGQGWWNPISPANHTHQPTVKNPFRLVYPDATSWPTPWACAGGNGGGVCISVRDTAVREKRLFVYPVPYAQGATVAEIICDADARHYGPHFSTPAIQLRYCDNQASIDADFAAHMAFVEAAYALRPWASRPDVADWARDIRLVLNLHGQHWTGYVFNTFDRMAETLRFVADHAPAQHIAAYLPGWEGRYYFDYPNFRPAEALGGAAGFARLAATARELGIRLMPMFGAHGANAQRYPDWERAAFRNRSNRYAFAWNKPDWDGDRSGEEDQLFLNPGEPRFREHLVRQISAMVKAYDLEIVYLDTTAAWNNDPRYHLYEGYRQLCAELRALHPQLMIAGEGWTDALLAIFPINLSWLGISRRFRYPQLLANYGRALQHLNEGAPGLGSTGVYEGGYTPATRHAPSAGHIASISIVDDTLTSYREELLRLIVAPSVLY